MSDLAVAAILAATILAAGTISVEIGLSVALVELALGVVVGNALHLDVPGWLAFVGSFAGIVLTFLAGAEVDVPQLRREWRASLSIGLVSFIVPFLASAALVRSEPLLAAPLYGAGLLLVSEAAYGSRELRRGRDERPARRLAWIVAVAATAAFVSVVAVVVRGPAGLSAELAAVALVLLLAPPPALLLVRRGARSQ